MRSLTRADRVLIGFSILALAAAAGCEYGHVGTIGLFATSAFAIAVLAALVGRSVDRLGDRIGSGSTGFLQSALGNLPELFIGIFALRAGLVGVLQFALIGSILANVLLVLGISFLAGGIKNGPQKFSTDAPRLTLMLLVLAVAIIMIPTLSFHIGVASSHHEVAMSNIAALVLLLIFVLSIPSTLKPSSEKVPELLEGPLWPIGLVIVVLGFAGVGALFASDWFIEALTPAMNSLHISQTFAGLVIIAIVGSAVENFIGIKLAVRNRPDYSLAVILQSPVQIALGLIPARVLVSNFVGPHPLTLVLPTMLFAVLALGTIVAIVIVFDGESTWLEGAALIGLYFMVSAAFWWGQ